MITHNEEKQYPCSHCGKTFFQKITLNGILGPTGWEKYINVTSVTKVSKEFVISYVICGFTQGSDYVNATKVITVLHIILILQGIHMRSCTEDKSYK